jgi:hypothetical protein
MRPQVKNQELTELSERLNSTVDSQTSNSKKVGGLTRPFFLAVAE